MGIFDKIKSIEKLNEDALKYIDKTDCSWHDTYKNSSYIYIGNLDTKVTEGDIIVMFSQFGEPIDINLVRDEETGESKGYCFLAYADQRSTVLAVDNFIGYKLLDRPLVVDHVLNYRLPKKYTNNENNSATEEYKPSGAEGGGIGVYNILRKKQNSKEDDSYDNTEETEALDDELRTRSFEKVMKRKKEKEQEKDKVKNKDKHRDSIKEKYSDGDRHRFRHRDNNKIKDNETKLEKEKEKKQQRKKEREKEKEKKRERTGERRKDMQEKEKIKTKIKGDGRSEVREQNQSEVEQRKEKMKERERYEHKRDLLKSRHNVEKTYDYHEKNSEKKCALKKGNRKDKYKNKHREKCSESEEEKSRKHSFSDKYQDRRYKKHKYNYDETYHKRTRRRSNNEENYHR